MTVRGRDEVVVISADEFRRLKGDLTRCSIDRGNAASPDRGLDIASERTAMPVRKVAL